jgi:hypothetical protein
MKETLNKEVLRFIRYLGFKMDCLREQEANPLTIDVVKAQRHSDELEVIVTEKVEALSKVMPKIPVISKRKKPAVMIKADGSLSAHGVKWYALLRDMHLPATTEGTIDVIDSHKDGNPKSPAQVKEWLQMLGWEPCTFKYDRNKVTGEEKKIPQIRYVSPSDPRKGLLTESVLRLKSREPGIEILEGLTVAAHRKSIFDGFIDKSTDGKAVAEAGGFTNTLRLKHRAPVVNLPKVGSAWGEEIRGCIVAPAGEVVCGADVSSLESCTKRHYMWDYDPAYVTEMSVEGFDEHLDLAQHAKEVTQEQIDLYNKGLAPELKAVRNVFKPANYAGVYGVRELTLSRQTGMSVKRCKALLDAYWERNWSVNEIAKDQYIKDLKDGSKWLKNPVSGFYYSLRNAKDAFSTLNQGTGVFVFDMWVLKCRAKGVVFPMQYHDEHLSYVKIGNEDRQKKLLQDAMKEVNETLKLNVEITSDIQFGDNYASVH